MKNKCEGNGNNVKVGDFNSPMDKMDKVGGNKRQKLYRCCSNYVMQKLIAENKPENYGEEKTQNPLSSLDIMAPRAVGPE